MWFKVSLFVVLLLGLAQSRPEEDYTKKFDNVDVTQILNSDRLLTNYVNCLMDRGRCGPDAKELKRLLPDILEHGCTKCNDVQKQKGEEVIDFLMDHKPDVWAELQTKYDPSGIYKKKYQTEYDKHLEEKKSKEER